MSIDQEDKLRQLERIFVATDCLELILTEMKNIRLSSKINKYETPPKCMFVTGEKGVGKTRFFEKYIEKHEKYDVSDISGEKTIVPVLYCELPKAKHPKPVVSELLSVLGDPLAGLKGDVRQLTERLVFLLRESQTELIIVDEVQHAIETTNKNVIQEIGEWFKILINKSRIPMVFVGVPWSLSVLDVNAQLQRRVRKSRQILNYTLDNFVEFQMFLQKVEEQLPVTIYRTLWEIEMAFRLFASSKGNVSDLIEGVIIPACEFAIYANEEIVTEKYFIKAVDENIKLKYKNPFLANSLNDVIGLEQKTSSTWSVKKDTKEQRVINAKYAKVKFKDLKLSDYLSKK